MNMPPKIKMTHRHRPLWRLWNGVRDISFLKRNFPQYNPEGLPTILGGYHKAFDEYYVFRLTYVLYQLRKNLGLTLDNEPQFELTNDKELENSILIEYFIVFLQVLMDHMAVYMPFFFENPDEHRLLICKKIQRQIRSDSNVFCNEFRTFSQIRKIFLENKINDTSLSNYMSRNMAWFDEINQQRNSLIHGGGWLWFESGDYDRNDPKFKIVKGLLMKKEWEPSLKKYIAVTYYNFREFLSFYEKHFRQKCETGFKNFAYGTDPLWESADSSFYRTMDYFYNEGKSFASRK